MMSSGQEQEMETPGAFKMLEKAQTWVDIVSSLTKQAPSMVLKPKLSA